MTTDKFLNKYRIPSARAVWHDYNGGEYFVTICTAHRECYFGEIRNGEMEYSILGRYAVENLKQIKLHYPYCEIPLFVVMPNHIHAMVVIDIDDGGGVGGGIGGRDDVHIVSMGETNEIKSDDVHIVINSDDVHIVSTGETGETGETTGRRLKNTTPNEKMQSISRKRGRLSTSMGGLKRAISCFANAHQIEFGWQTRFHDHIIRNRDEMNRIASYIENNPFNWKEDKFYTA